MVFSGSDLYTASGTILSGKELGLVLTIGVRAEAYHAGAQEGFTIDELTRPYQAFARHFGFVYQPVLPIFQFSYLKEGKRQELLVDYVYYVTAGGQPSLAQRTTWLMEKLSATSFATPESEAQMAHVLAKLQDNYDEIENLSDLLAGF